MSLSYQISIKLSEKFCFVHNMGISASMAGDAAVVKVCCPYFKGEVENELKKQFNAEYISGSIRLQLPGATISINPSTTIQSEE